MSGRPAGPAPPGPAVPVLEVGGTHATASVVDTVTWRLVPHRDREVRLQSDAAAGVLLDALAGCASAVLEPGVETLAVAIPGPFDYEAGIGRFRAVGKFDALDGVDVGRGLLERLTPPPGRISFVNDAAAFGLGEWLAGAASGTTRAVSITLGTGVGSAFVADGAVISTGPTVPPEGHVHRLTIGDRPIEEVVSRRAIRARFRAAGGSPDLDVREIAARAADGDARALASLTEPLVALGEALAPWLARFAAEVLVVGGSMSAAWSLVEPALRRGLRRVPALEIPIRRASDTSTTTAIGAVWHAVHGAASGSAARVARNETR